MLNFIDELVDNGFDNRIDVIAHCNNPESMRTIVGITFFRKSDTLELAGASSAVENAQSKLRYCPPNCIFACALKTLATASPEFVQELVNARSARITETSEEK